MVKIEALCEKCGKPVTLVAYQNATVSYVHHEDCPTPVIRVGWERNPYTSEPSVKV